MPVKLSSIESLGDPGDPGGGEKLSARFSRQMQRMPDGIFACCFIVLLLAASLGASSPALCSSSPEPISPRLATISAFDRDVALTESLNAEELKRGANLLWIDSLAAPERATAYASLKRGEVQIHQVNTLDRGELIACPGGIIHHWVGVIFIPSATLNQVLSVLEDYDHQSIYYAPDVERSRILSRDGDHFRVFLRFRRHKVITVVLDTEHDIQYFHDSPGLAHSRSSAYRISEVENAGKNDEREKPPGEDDGFLWRMETWWRLEQRDGGVYVQSEVLSLTRDIPAGLGWLIGPFVTSIPRETLAFTLRATRDAVNSASRAPHGAGQAEKVRSPLR